ncbi:hypothetical protein SOHN41_03453 [Shewanella sp. HN-41]|nr:hypothetical protein SOHN41_03453 [Shewanella sp. HN-41]
MIFAICPFTIHAESWLTILKAFHIQRTCLLLFAEVNPI